MPLVATTKRGSGKNVSVLLTKEERRFVQSAVGEAELFILPLSVTGKGNFVAEF